MLSARVQEHLTERGQGVLQGSLLGQSLLQCVQRLGKNVKGKAGKLMGGLCSVWTEESVAQGAIFELCFSR